jgi:4-diphosphocytidyl-2-C-methyl-D-erythritol kinase
MSEPLILPAFAKINLHLRVLERRKDGYHNLDTVFQTISLHDTISISLVDGPHVVLSSNDRLLRGDENNLVIRAVRLLQSRYAAGKGAHLRLDKRIPMQAGLGGGSSDAAVTLIGLAHLWEINIPRAELIALGSILGADVSFFFYGGRARATGLGDCVESVDDAPEQFLLVIKPNANISTAEAYKALDERSLTSPDAKTILSTSSQTADSDKIDSANFINDFEAVVFDLEPEIRRAKNALLKAGAGTALLAGSGSGVFGVFDSEDAQRRAIQAIELEAGWRVFPCRTVARRECRDAFGDLNLFS